MKQILIQLLIAAPALIEANIIDPLYWKYPRQYSVFTRIQPKGSDKPGSTYIRGVLFIIVALITQLWIKDNWAILALIGCLTWHVAIFNYNVNIWLGQRLSYKQNWFIFGNPFVKLILLLGFIVIYLTFNSTINQGASLPWILERFR